MEEQSLPAPNPPPPLQTDYSTFVSNPVGFAQEPYDYWSATAAGPFMDSEGAFLDTLASENWSNGSPDGGLLGQMAAIW